MRRIIYTVFMVATLWSSWTLSAPAQLVLAIDTVDLSLFPEVRLKVHVTLGGSGYSPLRLTDYDVQEDGRIQPALAGFCEDSISRPPLSVLMIIDRSNSMGPFPFGSNAIVAARQAASGFVGRLGAQDEVALLTFNETVQLAQGWTMDLVLMANRINAISTTGGTALWDAIRQGVAVLQPRVMKKILIVLTDGRDTNSSSTFAMALADLAGSGIVVYSIGLGSNINDAELRTLAQNSGGRYYKAPTGADLDAIYREISQQVSSTGICELRYTSPLDCLDGGSHTIRVSVRTTSGTAFATVNYRAPYDSSTFSRAALSVEPLYIVESAEHLVLPLNLRTSGARRPPRMLSWDMELDSSLVHVDSVSTSLPGATLTSQWKNGRLHVVVLSATPLDSTVELCRLHLTGLPSDLTRRTPLRIHAFAVDQLCTVLSQDEAIVTVSGFCERAMRRSPAPPPTRIAGILPNPATGDATVLVQASENDVLLLELFSILGSRVAVVYQGQISAGSRRFLIHRGSLPAGPYRLVMHTTRGPQIFSVVFR